MIATESLLELDEVEDEDKGPTPEQRARTNATRRHVEMLVVSTLIVALAVLLQVRPDERVAFVGLPQYPLPHTCPMRAHFNRTCPGCGLTRGIVHLAHGDWRSALRCHRLSVLFAVLILLQFPYRVISLRQPSRRWLRPKLTSLIAWTLIAALIGNWLVTLAVESTGLGGG